MDGLTATQIWAFGTFASLIAGLATTLGAIPVLFLKKELTEKNLDMFLGFAAGFPL